MPSSAIADVAVVVADVVEVVEMCAERCFFAVAAAVISAPGDV